MFREQPPIEQRNIEPREQEELTFERMREDEKEMFNQVIDESKGGLSKKITEKMAALALAFTIGAGILGGAKQAEAFDLGQEIKKRIERLKIDPKKYEKIERAKLELLKAKEEYRLALEHFLKEQDLKKKTFEAKQTYEKEKFKVKNISAPLDKLEEFQAKQKYEKIEFDNKQTEDLSNFQEKWRGRILEKEMKVWELEGLPKKK